MKKTQTEASPNLWAIGWAVRALVLVAFAAAFAVPLGLLPIITVATRAEAGADTPAGPITILLSTPVPTPVPVVETPTPTVPRIGIIAGHMGYDVGAVCEDNGLLEADINLDVARRVAAQLEGRGWQVDLLNEFDDRLRDYRASALLSIHADSCSVPGKSGFKVARAASSYIPVLEDRLVNCVSKHYSSATNLAFDANTITFDMSQYHAFYEIDKSTPAAIIEIGFMLDDQILLTQKQDVIARAIFDGLVCFIEGE